jgi:Family of unknown function (DUF5683)
LKKIILLLVFSFLGTLMLSAQRRGTATVTEKTVVPDSIAHPKMKTISKDSLKNKVVVSAKDSILKDSGQAKASFFSRKSATPKKAMLFSAVLPGAGQIYNKTGWWWKLPLCYGAYAATGYNLYKNRTLYKQYYTILSNYTDDKNYNNPTITKAVADTQRQRYRKKVESAWIGLFAAHLYCVSDAFVTAHLNQFEINDDLSLKISPAKESLGIGLNFIFLAQKENFKKAF